MPLYDYRCEQCEVEIERIAPMAARHEQRCDTCSGRLVLVLKPQRTYVPFNPYYDEGLDVEVTGRQHRQRVMRDLKVDYRDRPSPGDLSARRDKMMERRKERLRA